MIRVPIQVNRRPITFLQEQGYTKSGGYFVFNLPDEKKPSLRAVQGHNDNGFEKILWCPYCGEWTVFEQEYEIENNSKKHARGSRKYSCQGSCHWAHTEDYWVVKINNLWPDK